MHTSLPGKFTALAVRTLAVLVVLAGAANAQPSQLQLATPAPAATSVGTQVVGVQSGGQVVYYWVVARYPIGTVVSLPASAATVGTANYNTGNYVKVSWLAMPGATGYDVVRSTSPSFPGSCSACAVATNTAAVTLNDQSPSAAAYTQPAIAQTGLATFTLNNIAESQPYVQLQLNSNQYRVAPFTGPITPGDGVQINANGVLSDSGTPAGGGSDLVRTDTPNVYVGGFINDFTLAKWRPPLSTVAALPAAGANTNAVYEVTDGASSSDCVTGLGTSIVWCASNGSAWTPLSGSGGTGTVTHTGALTSLSMITGNNAADIKVTNITTDSGLNNLTLPGTMTTGNGSGSAGAIEMGAGTDTSIGANTVGWGAPTTVTTAIRYVFPNANPTVANSLMLFGTVASNESALTFTPYNIPATIAAHQTIVATSTTATKAATLPACTDTGGNHLNYDQTTDTYSCGTSGGGGSGTNAYGCNISAGVSTTTYCAVYGQAGASATESTRYISMPSACTAKNLLVEIAATESTGSLTVTLRRATIAGAGPPITWNAMADTALTVNVPNTSTAGGYIDTSDTISVAQWERLSLSLTNSSGTSAVVRQVSFQCI